MKRVPVFKPNRGAATKKFNGRAHIDKLYHSSEWMSYRTRYLNINSRCYACGKQSQVVDHLITHKGDIKLFEQNDNHIPLCTICHNKITALFDRYHVQKYQEKLRWLSSSRAKWDISFKVMVIPYKS
jgi:5-methylcytosine-specific restriction endonuclease McrA